MTDDSAIDEARTSPGHTATVNRLAYINLQSDNGAIVLNVSNGGLCFHSVDPVRRSETIRFWFLDHNHRIEADGRLAWMDETNKTGGLQFITLPAEARAQIRDWISQPAAPRTAGGKPVQPHSPPAELPTLSASRLNRNPTRDNSVPHKVSSANSRERALLSGFSGGLVFGILISALTASAFLLHAHRRIRPVAYSLGRTIGSKIRVANGVAGVECGIVTCTDGDSTSGEGPSGVLDKIG